VRVNVGGVIHTIRAVAPRMQERGYGRIVNVASSAAIGTALPGTTFYAATKAEVLILTRRFAMELGGAGDIANAVAFLASPESRFVTAQVLTVDGGRMDYIGQ
jgi:3-oxoacyl-[acyl-carrier protein] reductase